MVFHLSPTELQNSFDAIKYHGYTALLPAPPEWGVVEQNWTDVQAKIAALDLDEYRPHAPLRVYAPKSRALVRPVWLLHPIDLIIYTALTLIAKDDLETHRVPVRAKRVFSYRSDAGAPNRLYGTKGSFNAFLEQARRKARRSSTKVVAVADIADFYPRIYQHRLENVIRASARSTRVEEVARVLVSKLISNLLGKNSYGIPVGPFASRILGEAILIDVDASLLSDGVDFVRWVDDYSIFCASEAQAQKVLFRLAEYMFENQGLTLSALKTKILASDQFENRLLRNPREDVDDARLQLLMKIMSRFNPYEDDEIELSDEEEQELESAAFDEMLTEAVADRNLVDYETVSAILRHPTILDKLTLAAKERIANTLLDNLEHLYPVSEEVSLYLQSLVDVSAAQRKRITKRLFRSMETRRGEWPPDYHLIWMLAVFISSPKWGRSKEVLQLFRNHPSDAVRRFAALALHSVGSRAEAVAIKGDWQSSSPLTRLAILMASHKFGSDERRHWRTSLGLTGILEKLV